MFLLILSVYSLDNLDGISNPFLNENGSLILYSSAFSLLQDLSGLSGGMKDDKNTTGDKELSFWRRLSYSIGYSGGICWTGSDLRKYTDWTLDPIELISANLYYLNFIELSVIYPFNNEKGIEVGAGYGWAYIKPSKYDNWEFKLPIILLGYKSGRITLTVKYILILAKDYGRVSGSTSKEGEGEGISFIFNYKINKYINFALILGSGKYMAKEYFPDHTSEYPVKMCYNGAGFIIGYNFNFEGGTK